MKHIIKLSLLTCISLFYGCEGNGTDNSTEKSPETEEVNETKTSTKVETKTTNKELEFSQNNTY